VIAVSRGWTAATLKVRVYEMADRVSLHAMDRVVCVSAGQAAKVRRAGVPAYRVVVIHNAIRTDRFDNPNGESYREALRSLFPEPPGRLVCAAGRLSPEKGFDVLVEAAAILRQQRDGHKPLDIGFVLFGDGPLRPDLCRQIAEKGLERRFILAGFRQDLDSFLPFFDLVVLPSFTEGLPNVALEAFASGVPVVATAVGGTPEVVEDGVSGFLVRPGDPPALASRILAAFQDEENRRQMGIRGRQRVRDHFTFEAQSQRYQHLFAQLNPVRYQESRRHHATPMMRPTS
jgi:glycosyltransferase involved in cell wall biosynthesis